MGGVHELAKTDTWPAAWERLRRQVYLRQRRHRAGEWDYRLSGETSGCIGSLSQRVNHDLFEIAKTVGKGLVKPPKAINHLWLAGATTVCLPPDDPRLDEIHEPYCHSGIFLAPVIRGFSMVYFSLSRASYRRTDW